MTGMEEVRASGNEASFLNTPGSIKLCLKISILSLGLFIPWQLTGAGFRFRDTTLFQPEWIMLTGKFNDLLTHWRRWY